MPHDITNLEVADTLECSAEIRRVAQGLPSVQGVAEAHCHLLYEMFAGPDEKRACVLVRFYVTTPYSALPAEDQQFAKGLLPAGITPRPQLRCLALLGSRGDVAAWNDRRLSERHRAIPLPSVAVVEQAPMIAQLFRQMGASIADIVHPAPHMLAPARKLYNVFHVAEAKGSPHIPAQQDFVQKYGVQSVVGFGGVLPWGEWFAMILFSRVPISAKSAARFRTLALDVRATLRGFEASQLFDSSATRDTLAGEVPDAWPASVENSSTRSGPAVRTFQDPRGVEWVVWAVVPSMAQLDAVKSPALGARLNSSSWQKGWLLFESRESARRLRPIPDTWESASVAELRAMCEQARPVKQRPAT